MAETTRLLFAGLLRLYPDQYEIHQLGLCAFQAVTRVSWPVYPTKTHRDHRGNVLLAHSDRAGQTSFPELADRLRPDIVFAFNDPQNVQYLCVHASLRPHKLILYLNFDGLPVPGAGWVGLSMADALVATSEFSREGLVRGFPDIRARQIQVAYSPADTERFRPAGESERRELRQRLFPSWMPLDAFVLGWVGKNQWRKQIWLQYWVVQLLREGGYWVCNACDRVTVHRRPAGGGSLAPTERPRRPRGMECRHCSSSDVAAAPPIPNIVLWAHMANDATSTWPKSWLELEFGLSEQRGIHYTATSQEQENESPAEIATLYRLWDGLLYLSGGEGFGLPAWEAMCSGLPVVHSNYGAHAEYLRHARAGIPVGGTLQPQRGDCILRLVADIDQSVEAVRRLYHDRALSKTLGIRGRNFATSVGGDRIVHFWHRCFQSVASSGVRDGFAPRLSRDMDPPTPFAP